MTDYDRDDLADVDLAAAARDLRVEVVKLTRLMAGPVGAAQYESAPIPRPKVDTSERSKGEHADPLPDVVSDGRRLALRVEVIRARREIAESVAALRAARRRIEDAFDRWEGSTPDPRPGAAR